MDIPARGVTKPAGHGEGPRIAFLSHTAIDSGAEQSLVNCIARWPDHLTKPLLVLGEEGVIGERAVASGVEVVVMPLPQIVRGWRRSQSGLGDLVRGLRALSGQASGLRRILDEHDVDVVVAASLKSLVYGLIAARRSGRPIVWSLHDRVADEYLSRGLVIVLRYLAPRLVDGIVVNSNATLQTLRTGRTPHVVSAPAIDLPADLVGRAAGDLRAVVMVGRIASWKGQDVFLQAFARVFKGSPVSARIVGGPLFGETEFETSLKQMAKDLGIAEQVEFTGHVADPWPYLAQADVLAHCSKIPEPFGMVVVQGMWTGCAVVATRPGGPEEIVTDGVDGLLVSCGDVDSMAAAFERLKDDEALRHGLALAGQRRATAYSAAATAPVLAGWLELLGPTESRSSPRTGLSRRHRRSSRA